MPAHEPRRRRYLRFLGPDVDADVDEELRFHLASLEADLRAQGLTDAAARREAARRFGDLDVTREALLRQDTRHSHRAARSSWWRDLVQDTRHALRSLAQHRAFTIAIIVVLALGVGATTAMFSAVDAALLRPLPFARPDRLVVLQDVNVPFDPTVDVGPRGPVHFPDLNDVASMRDQFSHVAAYAAGGLNLSDPANPLRVNAGVVTTDFFATLGVAPTRGRAFTAPAAGTQMGKYAAGELDSLRSTGATTPLRDTLVGDRARALLVLLGATGMLLLIACANVTNLLLSRASARQREIAVRAVLGATRSRLVRQLMTESVMLAVLGTVLGVALAPVALRIIRVLMPVKLAGIATAELDLRVLGFAAALALLTGAGFGLWPALGAARANAGAAIRTGSGHGATARAASRARLVLVITELALALVLLTGSGLMLRSFLRLTSTGVGLVADHVGTLEMSFPSRAGGRQANLQKLSAILDRLGGAPGVSAAGIVNDLPLSGEGRIRLSVTVDGAPPPSPANQRYARYLMASAGYFRAMNVPLVRGRLFTVADDSLAPRVAIINATMAREFWPGTDALGRTMHFPGDSMPVTVVGIVGDVRETALDKPPQPQMFFPIYEQTPNNVALVARGTMAGRTLLVRMTEAVHAVDPAQAVFKARMMDDVLSSSVAPRRTNTLLIALFGALALVLAALGVYAVVSYGVTQRHRELGIRSALGATSADLVTLVAREMIWVVALGVAIGLAAAWMLTQLIASQLYEVTARDPVIFVIAALALVVPAVAATLVPALRATRVSPATVMRAE